MAKIVTVRLLLDVEDEAEAFDGTNELLRELQQVYVPTSCLVDYEIGRCPVDYTIVPPYEEGEAF